MVRSTPYWDEDQNVWVGGEGPESGGGGGSTPLADVLAAGGDPEGNPITGPLTTAALTAIGNFSAGPDGEFYVTDGGDVFVSRTDPQTSYVQLKATGEIVVHTPAGELINAQPSGYVLFGSGATVGVTPEGGFFVETLNEEPPLAELPSACMYLWFDATDGAGKLKITAKTHDGTVVRGEMALTP